MMYVFYIKINNTCSRDYISTFYFCTSYVCAYYIFLECNLRSPLDPKRAIPPEKLLNEVGTRPLYPDCVGYASGYLLLDNCPTHYLHHNFHHMLKARLFQSIGMFPKYNPLDDNILHPTAEAFCFDSARLTISSMNLLPWRVMLSFIKRIHLKVLAARLANVILLQVKIIDCLLTYVHIFRKK